MTTADLATVAVICLAWVGAAWVAFRPGADGPVRRESGPLTGAAPSDEAEWPPEPSPALRPALTRYQDTHDPVPHHRRSPMEHERDDAADWTGWRPSYDGEDHDPGEPYQRGETE